MPKLPAYQTSMIGSMPQKTPEKAFQALSDYPLTIPSWAQLPKRTFVEGMVPQCSEGFPRVRVLPDKKSIWLENDDDLPNVFA